MNVGLIGTGAIAQKHGDCYKELGFNVAAASDIFEEKGRKFVAKYGGDFVADWRDLCARPDIDYVDVCTFPDSRPGIVAECAKNRRHVQVQKPIALTLEAAKGMVDAAREANIKLGVISQHRFDDATIFVNKALAAGRLGKILQADSYVKWHRPQSYYDNPGKGTWKVEGGGALINQAIHGVDLLLYLIGPVSEIYANWQLAAAHNMESEDVVNAVIRYGNGATGVLQSSTAVWPGYPERIEIHGTKGTAIITGDKLTAWDVKDDEGDPAPVETSLDSGASDPMAISLEPIKRQFTDFANAIKEDRRPNCSGEDGYRALEVVLKVYESAREGKILKL